MDLPFESTGHRAAWVVAAGLFALALAGMTAWGGIRWLQRRREQEGRARFARQLAAQEAAAREQLAAELQDGFGHRLVLLRNGALTALAQPGSSAAVQNELHQISDLAAGALDEVRAITERLRSVELERLGFTQAVEELLARHLTQPGIQVFKDVDDLGAALSPPAALYFYRLVEALLRRVGRPAGATTVLFEVKLEPERIRLRVEHDAPGTVEESREALSETGGQVRRIGGEWRVSNVPGSGTRWEVLIPREPG